MTSNFQMCIAEELSEYAFPDNHPFCAERLSAFKAELEQRVAPASYLKLNCRKATDDQLALFHDPDYIRWVKQKSKEGCGYLDQADTPAFCGIFEAASRVVGTVLAGIDNIMAGVTSRVFIPISGLHHSRRDAAAGFCAFNDIGVAIEHLRTVYSIRRIAYVDIDAHHGDGVFYAYEADPNVLIVDFHEDGHFIYPGTGHADEIGIGEAKGTKLNLPLPMNVDDEEFLELWPEAERFIDEFAPEFILLQAGADAMSNDPVTDMGLTTLPYAHATRQLRALADKHCSGRMLAMGGGGYNLKNVAAAWTTVVTNLL